ncbi:MAG: hypothetical protein IPL46_16895 [Saprospiraceae bacterium]|nr:hypothetical protein [Saprospiraceae bacterium]
MIKFFRKIRQNLLSEGKTGKYLKYAIGEILLVVIGILIALSINNWNDSRKINQQEKSYLKRLLLENKQDVLTFSNEIERLENNNQKITNLSEAFKDKNCSDSLLVLRANEYVIFGSLYPVFNPSTSTYEDLSSTGNLSVIKNTQLRDQIVGHYEDYELVESNFKINNDWATPIDAPLWINTDALKFDTNFTSLLFPNASIENLARELRKEQAIYLRNAALHYWINEDCLVYLKQIKEDTSIFIDLLGNTIQK